MAVQERMVGMVATEVLTEALERRVGPAANTVVPAEGGKDMVKAEKERVEEGRVWAVVAMAGWAAKMGSVEMAAVEVTGE